MRNSLCLELNESTPAGVMSANDGVLERTLVLVKAREALRMADAGAETDPETDPELRAAARRVNILKKRMEEDSGDE